MVVTVRADPGPACMPTRPQQLLHAPSAWPRWCQLLAHALTSRHRFSHCMTEGKAHSLSLCTSSKMATGLCATSRLKMGTTRVECTRHRCASLTRR